MLDKIWWVARVVMMILIALLLVRAAAEYLPALETLPPVRALIRNWDPWMVDFLKEFGISWSHDVRGIGLPAVAIVLIMVRVMIDDFMVSLFHKKPVTRAAEARKASREIAASTPDLYGGDTSVRPTNPGAPATPAAPADPLATSLIPQAPVPTATGTRFQPQARPAPSQAGPRIGRYDIAGELGRGAMGVVYKGVDPTIGRTVAIKTISAVGNGPEIEEYRSRFLVEARSAGRLNHPGIVSVYDVTDDDQGRPSLVLEFIDGTPFDKLLADKKLTLPQILDVVIQTAKALDYAHAAGVVHRDVKPANIMVTKDNLAKLSDFGIAKMDGTGMTTAGQVLGTPAYMSPEQCTGGNVDSKSDIFSLGAVLYTATVGTRPFAGNTFTAVAYKVVHEEVVVPSSANSHLPAELDAIIMKSLAKDPAQRYASAGEMAAAIEAVKATIAA